MDRDRGIFSMHNEERRIEVVSRADERLASVRWDLPRYFGSADVEHDGGSVLVLCGGFEDRALGALSSFGATKDLTVVLVRYRPEYQSNKDDAVRRWSRESGVKLRECSYDRQSPAGGGEEIVGHLGTAKHVYVDVSGMSRLLVVQVVVALVRAGRPFTIVYAEADEYYPTESEFRERAGGGQHDRSVDFLSSGIFEVAATPELGSVAMLGEATRLVVFPSMETVQMKNLLQEVQPTYVDAIYGLWPRDQDRWRCAAAKQLNARELQGQTGVSEHEASTLDYTDTLRVLLGIYAERSMFDRMLVAPIGSKMQAVAVGIVRSVLTDLQVVYPTPQELKADHYTKGVGPVHHVRVPEIVRRR